MLAASKPNRAPWSRSALLLSLTLFALLLRDELYPPRRPRAAAAPMTTQRVNASAGASSARASAARHARVARLYPPWPRGAPLLERWAQADEPFSEEPRDPLPCGARAVCPWYEEGATGAVWEPAARCNPYSRLCSCLAQWLPGDGDPCRDAPPNPDAAGGASTDVATLADPAPTLRGQAVQLLLPSAPRRRVRLFVSGWLTEWPYEAGLRSCARSFCDVRHGDFNRSDVDANVYSVLDPTGQKYPALGKILVGVALESPLRFAGLDYAAFPYYFHTGVSHRRGKMELHTTYNNYWPAQFRSRGAPFAEKRNALLAVYSNCESQARNRLIEEVGALTPVESLGRCHQNAEVAAVLPRCANLPRGGRTVWQQSECLLHHYKFYLAVENTREPDYITEKLWQGLRAGAVPIYLGAPNVRHFVPDDSVIFVDDFASVAKLVAHVKRALADEALYERHLAWKRAPLPGRFVNSAIARSQDGLLCAICDRIAPEIGRTFGPLAGAHGASVTLPPCIARALVAGEFALVRGWAIASPGWQAPGLELLQKTYVISVKAAGLRQEALRRQLTELGLGADLVAPFDNLGFITDQDLFCWQPRSRVSEHPPVDREISANELSVAMKHVAAAWDIFRSGVPFALVLEDDVLLSHRFGVSLAASIAEAPAGWDYIFIGGCYNLQSVYWGGVKVTDKLWRVVRSRCAHAYLMSFKGALRLLETLPLRYAFDFQLSDGTGGPEIYWVEPPRPSKAPTSPRSSARAASSRRLFKSAVWEGPLTQRRHHAPLVEEQSYHNVAHYSHIEDCTTPLD